MKSTEEYETIIAELEKENERLKEENEIVWDMLKSVQEDAFYHAWIRKVVDENEEEGKDNV